MSERFSLRVHKRTWLAVSGLATAAVIGGVVVCCVIPSTVTIKIGEQSLRHRTRADTVREALDDAGVQLDEADVVWPDPSTALRDGMTITVHKAFTVQIDADGKRRQVQTQFAHPLNILTEQNIQVSLRDQLVVDGATFSRAQLEAELWPLAPASIRVQRSALIKVRDGNRTLFVHTPAVDVGRALAWLGLDLYLADQITPPLDTPITPGMAITIRRSQPVTLVADGRTLATRAPGPQVGDALAAVGVAPVGQDFTIPPPDTPVQPEMVIQVVRVTEDLVIEQTPIPSWTIYQPDNELPAGARRVLQTGAPGQRERRVLVRYEDGRAVQRHVQDEQIIQSPVPTIIAYGTRPNGAS
jgi:uncharacterized protein YabE (DUF348 family)